MTVHTRIFIGLGSNLGDREKYLSDALFELQKSKIHTVRESAIYASEAWGVRDQAPFLNQVVEVRTHLFPRALLQSLKSIENTMGRISRKKWHEREIDLDLLYYGNQIIDQPDLRVPHLFVRKRRFVLLPLCQIAPDFVDPETGETIEKIFNATADDSEVRLFKTTT